MKKILNGMTHNGKVITFTELFWAIPFNLFSVYAVLYMMELGLSEREIGLVQTILIISQIISSVISGRLTDVLGSRRTTIIFDIISWALAAFIWSISSSFIGFAIAAFFNGINKIVQVSFTHLISYNTSPKERLNNYTGMHIMVIVGGFFAPVGGLIISNTGLINGMRSIYLFSGIIMLIMFIFRHIAFKEPESHPERDKAPIFKGVIASLHYFLSDKRVRKVFILQAIIQFYRVFKPIFYYAFLRDSVGLKSEFLSIVPVVISIITGVIMLLVVPKIKNEPKAISIGVVSGAVSMILLALSAEFSLYILIPVIILDALATSIIGPVVSSFWISNLDPRRSTTQLSAGFFLFGIVGIPAGLSAAELYKVQPNLPFLAAAILLFVAAVITFSLLKEQVKDE